MIKLKDLLTEAKGDCYQAAGRLIMNFMGDKKHKLVHGMVNGQGALKGLRFGHAWVEYGSKVMDHSNGKKQEMPKALYYAVGNIKPRECKYYTGEEAATWMLKSKHWGPWQMSGDTIKLYAEDIPDVRGEIGKKRLRVPSSILDKLDEGTCGYGINGKLGESPAGPHLIDDDKKRIPRKKGQHRGSSKHSDLYTDENPSGTIHGLKFATVKDAQASVSKIKSSGKKHAHKVQAAVAMEQRAKAAGKTTAAAVYRKYINSVKKTETDLHSKLSRGHKPDYYQLGTSEFKPFDKSRDEDIEENYKDGKKKGKSRPGRVKRAGASCKGSVTSLRAKARKYGGEKGKMYHWCANMKGGKKK